MAYGALAQLARAPALQAGGPGFESLMLHHMRGEPGFGLGHSTTNLYTKNTLRIGGD